MLVVVLSRAIVFIVVCALVMFGVAPKANAQGLFDAVAEAFVDTVNSAAGIAPDAAVRRVQVDAVAVAVRGSDEDWERFIASTMTAAEGLAGGASVRDVLETTRSATLAVAGGYVPAGGFWDSPTFTDLQVAGLGAVPAWAVEAALPWPPGKRDWRLEALAFGAVDTPGVDRMVALLSADRHDAPVEPRDSSSAGWSRSHYLFVFAEDALDTVIAATQLPGFCYTWGDDAILRLPNGIGPLTLLDLDGDGRDEMLFSGVCRQWIPASDGSAAETYALAMEIAYLDARDGSVRMISHSEPGRDPPTWAALRVPFMNEGFYDVGVWAGGPHPLNPGVLFHSHVRVERGSERDALVVARHRFDPRRQSQLNAGMRLAHPDVPLEDGDHAWTKRLWVDVSGMPVVEILAGGGEAHVDSVAPFFIDAIHQRQRISLRGSGFGPTTEVVVWADDKLFAIPPDRREVVSSQVMHITVGLFPETHEWRVGVRNGGVGGWSEYVLRVIAPR